MNTPPVITGTIDLKPCFTADIANSQHVTIGQLIYNEIHLQMTKVGIPLERLRHLPRVGPQTDWVPKVTSGSLWYEYNQRDTVFNFSWSP